MKSNEQKTFEEGGVKTTPDSNVEMMFERYSFLHQARMNAVIMTAEANKLIEERKEQLDRATRISVVAATLVNGVVGSCDEELARRAVMLADCIMRESEKLVEGNK